MRYRLADSVDFNAFNDFVEKFDPAGGMGDWIRPKLPTLCRMGLMGLNGRMGLIGNGLRRFHWSQTSHQSHYYSLYQRKRPGPATRTEALIFVQ